MLVYADAIRLQKQVAKKVIAKDAFGQIRRVCGVDASYRGDIAYCSAVVMDRNFELVESVGSKSIAEHPYLPGLFMLREAGPVLDTLKLLKSGYDLLLVDGHGMLHPRKCGLACYVGVTIDKPAIGVAKSLLCGTVRNDGSVELDGEVLGTVINFGRKQLCVSVGHRVGLESAVAIVKELVREGESMPEPLRVADFNSKLAATTKKERKA